MPAAAVIPAPIAYIKVVAVKKLVVGSVSRTVGSPPVGVKLTRCGTSCRWLASRVRFEQHSPRGVSRLGQGGADQIPPRCS